MNIVRENKGLIVCVAGSILIYKAVRKVYSFWTRNDGFVPIGTVKILYIYPAKSCKGKSVFSFHCSSRGASIGEIKDRHFAVIDGSTGLVFSARQKPQLVLVEVDVRDGVVTVTLPDGQTVSANIHEIKQKHDVRQTTHKQKRVDAVDCGEEISKLLSEYLDETDARMVMYVEGLQMDRIAVSNQNWWKNNTIPDRKEKIIFFDKAPTLIQTEASLEELNKRMDTPISQLQLRPIIVVDGCDAFDEDKWLDIRIGDVQLQSFRPCTRCVHTLVDPETGTRSPENQPLKSLREFRLAPEGSMREIFKESPVFGVHTGVDREGYIHVGQVVYVRYKPSAF